MKMAIDIQKGGQVVSVSGTSAKFTNALQHGLVYVFTCNTDCWIKMAATGGAAAADTANNMYVDKGVPIELENRDPGTTNSFLHVIQDSAAGNASLMVDG
jgi:hypothetical protein